MKPEIIRVLFLGEMSSSHAQSWMSLLDGASDRFEILSFSVPNSPYPAQGTHKSFGGKFVTSPKIPAFIRACMLSYVIRTFRPHVIHSFGAFPTAALYAPIIAKYKARLKWVMQVRGGPDVYMNQHDPGKCAVLKNLFSACDVLIADNQLNYDIAIKNGMLPEKCWVYGIVPGAGGLELDNFKDALAPSKSMSQVIWPKAYEGYESKGLPVLEAIQLAWPKIRGTRFIFTAVNPALQERLQFLPADLLSNIEVHQRLPRDKILDLMKSSRVVMAPSLLEGIPNALYEAMAAECVPIFSPLETYQDKFVEGVNILYARNLYPQEIADALVCALNDDELADQIASTNKKLVAEIANRARIAENVIRIYKDLTARQENEIGN